MRLNEGPTVVGRSVGRQGRLHNGSPASSSAAELRRLSYGVVMFRRAFDCAGQESQAARPGGSQTQLALPRRRVSRRPARPCSDDCCFLSPTGGGTGSTGPARSSVDLLLQSVRRPPRLPRRSGEAESEAEVTRSRRAFVNSGRQGRSHRVPALTEDQMPGPSQRQLRSTLSTTRVGAGPARPRRIR